MVLSNWLRKGTHGTCQTSYLRYRATAQYSSTTSAPPNAILVRLERQVFASRLQLIPRSLAVFLTGVFLTGVFVLVLLSCTCVLLHGIMVTVLISLMCVCLQGVVVVGLRALRVLIVFLAESCFAVSMPLRFL